MFDLCTYFVSLYTWGYIKFSQVKCGYGEENIEEAVVWMLGDGGQLWVPVKVSAPNRN